MMVGEPWTNRPVTLHPSFFYILHLMDALGRAAAPFWALVSMTVHTGSVSHL